MANENTIAKWEAFKAITGYNGSVKPSRRFVKFEKEFGYDADKISALNARQLWDLAAVRAETTTNPKRIRERREFCAAYLTWLGCKKDLVDAINELKVTRSTEAGLVARTQLFTSAEAVDDFILGVVAERLGVGEFKRDSDVLLPLRVAMQLVFNGLNREQVCEVLREPVLHGLEVTPIRFTAFQRELAVKLAEAKKYRTHRLQVEQLEDTKFLMRNCVGKYRGDAKAPDGKNSFNVMTLSTMLRNFNAGETERRLTIGSVAMSGKFTQVRTELESDKNLTLDNAIKKVFKLKPDVAREYVWQFRKNYEEWAKLK